MLGLINPRRHTCSEFVVRFVIRAWMLNDMRENCSAEPIPGTMATVLYNNVGPSCNAEFASMRVVPLEHEQLVNVEKYNGQNE